MNFLFGLPSLELLILLFRAYNFLQVLPLYILLFGMLGNSELVSFCKKCF